MNHGGPILGAGNGATVIDCQACGYAHLDPLPSLNDLERLYQGDQYYLVHNAGFTHKAHSSHFDEQLEDLEWHQVFFKENLDALASMIDGRNLLDYGAGCGLFARYALDNDWNVIAVEPSQAARDYARRVVGIELAEAMPPGKRYDAIRACYVLEHLIDPRQALLSLGEFLLPGGILCVVVPNEFNAWACAGRDKFGLDSYWIRPGLHLNYFTHNSIARLLQKSGYRVVDQVATFPTELFMIGGADFASDPDLGHKVHHARMEIELAMDRAGLGLAKLDIYRNLALYGTGRASVTYARKKR